MMNNTERLAESLFHAEPTSAALIYSPVNRRYFTGFPSSLGLLFVTAKEAYLLLDFRYAEAAEKKAKNCKVILFESMDRSIAELLHKHEITKLYTEMRDLSLKQAVAFQNLAKANDCEIVQNETLDQAILELRMIKSDEEIRKIEAAQSITDAAFSHMLDFIHEGVSEREIALEIEFFMRRHGAEALAFESIVAAGPNGSMCHAVPSDYQVKKGDLITMDTGAMLDGYHSDMTRTIALGSISDEQKRIYDTVYQAHMAVLDVVKPGVPCRDVDAAARDIIEADYPGTFGHGLGHSLGMEIHEDPRFSRLDATPCQTGMVITNEPGIYIAGKYGVRIEDMLLITETGCRSLTKSIKTLITL